MWYSLLITLREGLETALFLMAGAATAGSLVLYLTGALLASMPAAATTRSHPVT